MVEQSLKDKTVKGTFWSAADTFLSQGVTFIVGIVLARLLTPEEYGLVGIVLIFVIVLSGIVDAGFSQALIRKTDTTDDDYNTMFITNMCISIALFVFLYVVAPSIADFFSRPELINLTRVSGLVLIFQALSITQTTILTKQIDFKTKTKASVVSAVLSGVIGIVMAYMSYGVWALVAQKLSVTLMYTLCMWVLIRWWPKLKFNKGSFHYMWSFGWKLMLSGILNNIWNQLYPVVVGKFYSPSSLGQYTRSEQYASIFSMNLSTIVQRVSYPVLSEVQDDKARMVAGYRKIIKVTMFVTAILMLSMAAVSDPLIYCLIGPQWYEAATYLPLICISMSLYPLHAINLNMLQVQGRTDIFLYLEIIKKIIAIAPVVVGIFVNIYWMLIVGIVVGIINFFLNSYYSGKELGYSSWMQIKDVAPSYGVACVIIVAVYFFKYLPFSYWIVLPLQIVIGGGVLIIVCKLSRNEEYIEIKEMSMPYLERIFLKQNLE